MISRENLQHIDDKLSSNKRLICSNFNNVRWAREGAIECFSYICL